MNPGIYPDLPEAEYRALDYPSYSSLKRVLTNPHAYRYGSPVAETEAMRWGKMVDCATLTEHRFYDLYVVGGDWSKEAQDAAEALRGECFDELYIVSPYENFRTNEARKWKEAQLDQHPLAEFVTEARRDELHQLGTAYNREVESGRIRIGVETRDRVWAASQEILGNPHARAALEHGHAQVAMVWEMGGRLVKGLVDWVPEGHSALVDLKTSVDASPRGYRRQFERFRYDIQAAMYLEGWAQVGLDDRDDFLHIVQESKSLEVATYRVNDEYLERGRRSALEALEILDRCEHLNEWPGYTTGWADLEPWRAAA